MSATALVKWSLQIAGLLAALALLAPASLAEGDDCRETSAAQRSFADIIKNAEVIILAEAKTAEPVEGATSDVLEFSFKVKKNLKGRQRRALKIQARMSDKENGTDRGDLDQHQRMSFWDRMETRLVHVSSCAQDLTFSVGKTYLMIDPGGRFQPMTVAYEQIDSPDDLWLQAVKDMIDAPEMPAREMTLEAYLKAQQSVVFVMMPFCNDKLEEEGYRVAEISEPLVGSEVRQDAINPNVYRRALEGCDGLTVHLGIFYQPDQTRPEDAAFGALVYPGQRYIPVHGDEIHVSDIQTQIHITGPETVTLGELVASLQGP